MASTRGMPLLSGPPPQTNSSGSESSCRKCNKEFNMFFTRSRRCNHCGYSYCHSCSDFQALMPRRERSGYEAMPVCAYCIENLNITAAEKGQLKDLNLTKLKKYAKDYGIDFSDVVEKGDLVDRLITARQGNRWLPPARENYYRTHSVPQRATERSRGIFSRAMDTFTAEFQSNSGNSQQQQQQQQRQQSSARAQQQSYAPRARTTSHPNSFPRPDLEPDPLPPQPSHGSGYHNMNSQSLPRSRPTQAQYNIPRPTPGYASARPTPPPGSPPQQARSNYNQSDLNVPSNNRPRSASAPRTPQSTARAASPPTPVLPSLDELLTMPMAHIQSLPISTLKAVLFRNHVSAGMVVEKSELVAKVQALIDDERAEREATARRAEEDGDHELQEVLERSRREHEAEERDRERARQQQQQQQQQQDQHQSVTSAVSAAEDSASDDGAPAQPPPVSSIPESQGRGKLTETAQAMVSHLERTGLCVICQDEEANIAIVDCGHLAMCRACSDLIMKGTRECPLCRTRIITEARLLRIFKA